MRDWLSFPVCSPEFAKKCQALCDASGIDGVPPMHSEREPWSSWFRRPASSLTNPEHGHPVQRLGADAAGRPPARALSHRQSIVPRRAAIGPAWCHCFDPRRVAVPYFFGLSPGEARCAADRRPSAWIVRQIKNIPLSTDFTRMIFSESHRHRTYTRPPAPRLPNNC